MSPVAEDPAWARKIRLPAHVRGANEPCLGQLRGARVSVYDDATETAVPLFLSIN